MQTLPTQLYTADQTRQLDRILIDEYKLTARKLIDRAATAALALINEKWPDTKHLTFLCGGGHNGADGITLAIKAKAQGYKVSVYQLANADGISEETQQAMAVAQENHIDIARFDDTLPTSDLIIDAIFGTGLNRAVSGNYLSAIEAVNQSPPPVFSLDIASGLHADSGQILGDAINADATLSFIGLNSGLVTAEGIEHSGELFFNDLATPETVYQKVTPQAERITVNQFKHLLSPRKRNSHKGNYGHLLLVGGDTGMSGAIRLAAESGARTGSGLTTIATREANTNIAQVRPELMCHGVETAQQLTPLLDKATAITIGPGLGQDQWGQLLFQQTLSSPQPLVIDADALNLLSQTSNKSNNWILTPHPGEAARLLNCSTQQVQADRFAAIQQLQHLYGGVIVLKGAGTLIYNGKETIKVSGYGNPGMSTGGTGDVLAGVIGSLLAQGHTLLDAACLGVILHGLAGDKAAAEFGERGMLAMDLIPYLRSLVNLRF